jgi:hypothetical protein
MGLLRLPYVKFVPKHLRFVADFRKFAALSGTGSKRFEMPWKDRYPCLDDGTPETTFDAHYTYHPAWAARIVAQTMPEQHIDVSSTLHFCSMVSAFVPVEFYDIRPVRLALEGLACRRGDLLNLPFSSEEVASLSCMHVVEHIGLGRYGDAIDPAGDLKAMAELTRVLAKGGSLLFVVPVGKPMIRFNAHRIYSYEQIASSFAGLHIEQFALVDDKGSFTVNADPTEVRNQHYGCGCWWFKK